MPSCLVFLLLSSFQLLRVASYTLTMTPDHAHISSGPESVLLTCTADRALTACQFRWRDYEGEVGPLLDLSREYRSEANSTHLNSALTGYSYRGRGLAAGDCGVLLTVEGSKSWLVACRVQAEIGGWTYAWTDLYASTEKHLPHSRAPRESVVLPGGTARFTLRAQEALKSCIFYVQRSSRLVFNQGGDSRDNKDGHVYFGGGLEGGRCGLALSNVEEVDNGLVRGDIGNTAGTKNESRYMTLTVARRPTAPSLTVVQGNYSLEANCVVKDSRPLPEITWLLGDAVVRQDSREDSPGNPEDEWRWPWMGGSITQKVAFKLKREDNGKRLTCRVSHVSLDQPMEVNERILLKTSCPPLSSNTSIVTCFSGGQEVNCTRPQPIGSWAEILCKPHYSVAKDVTYRRINCTDLGEWDRPVFDCQPDCGRRKTNKGRPHISGGETARVGEFPWHVAIYEKVAGSFEQICGGSLISTRIVISAAHCFWSEQFSRQKNYVYGVAAGKHKRAWMDPEDNDQVQRREVELVTLHPRFRGRQSSFQSDIALVRLATPVDISANVNLLCVDWANLWEESQLQNGNSGTVPGWGYTEDERLSTVLKHVQLPFIDHETCFKALDESLKPLFTVDKFCAGYANLSVSTCPGDSGGGLVFLHQDSNRYYLRGLVSISFKPASRSNLCYSQLYTAFTLVSNYHWWIRNYDV